MNTLNHTAHTLNQHHINTIPTRPDTTKAPAITWKHWTTHPVPATNIDQWFPDNTQHGLAIITGTISGNLEMTEIEGNHTHQLQNLLNTANINGTRPLFDRITNGWLEQSPSGGYHWIYRLTGTDVPGNQKLARTTKRDVIAETRGQGGYFIAAPTNGTHHQTGNPWTRINGGPETIATITTEEREQFHQLFRTLNQELTPPTPATHNPARTPTRPGEWANGAKPGEHFETETSWDTILTPHGWTKLRTDNQGTTYWLRPGKDPHNPGTDGQSATTSHAEDRDRLYVFSTSTAFEPETPYTKFGAWALLNHGGDHQAAARALAQDGWGKEPTITLTSIMPPTSKDTPCDTSSKTSETPSGPTSTTPSSATTATPSTSTPTTTHQGKSPSPSPSKTPTPSNTSPQSKEPSPPTSTAPDPATTLAETDDGNAHRLIHHHGHQLRYNPDRGQWLHWTGNRWAFQGRTDTAARELAKNTARTLPETNTAEKQWKKRSLSAAGITNTLIQARTTEGITTTFNDLDNHPWELNTPNGIINLRTGKLTDPDPTKLHTKTTLTTPNPNADRTQWEDFLTTTFPDRTIREYMQRLIGYATIGEVRENILPFAYGPGGNGKSVFFETIATILGDYATSAPAGFLMEQRFPQHPTELARLVGQRLVISQEFNERDRFDEAKVKALTGGDSITARFTHQDDFTFTPSHTLFIAGNHEPTVESGGDGFWRRLRKIPFLHKVPEHKKVGDLQQILVRDHAPAILAWIVEGAAWYALDGLMEPESVRSATEDYREAQDTVARFLEERCVLYPRNGNYQTTVKRFRSEYEAWCFEEGESPVKGRALAAQLKNHGVLVGREAPAQPSGRDRAYGGIRLASDEDAIAAEHERNDLF
ncbi:phage/plasmid primase, P4 family [Rothia sp. p3-SID1597]|nr:phage/plasmid primase, P4 family [Rothia sp. p3-SID1597]